MNQYPSASDKAKSGKKRGIKRKTGGMSIGTKKVNEGGK